MKLEIATGIAYTKLYRQSNITIDSFESYFLSNQPEVAFGKSRAGALDGSIW